MAKTIIPNLEGRGGLREVKEEERRKRKEERGRREKGRERREGRGGVNKTTNKQ